jgi:tRNA G10  N-methylase Trm11
MHTQHALRPHPARFTPKILPILAGLVQDVKRILDPFAGAGKIFELRNHGVTADIYALEIEPEWAAHHPGITVGNALALPWPNSYFDAIVTSPTYGNRMADHFTDHQRHKRYQRHTYRHCLGRPLHPENSGQLQWGEAYRAFHRNAWREAHRVLQPGGIFILNCKNHIRAGHIQDVTGWHINHIKSLGFTLEQQIHVPTPGHRHGANHAQRLDYEVIALLRKDEERHS